MQKLVFAEIFHLCFCITIQCSPNFLNPQLQRVIEMKTIQYIPDEVQIKVHAKTIKVEGPRGKLVRNLKYMDVDFELITNKETVKRKLKIESWFGSRKASATIHTAVRHAANLITGVPVGYRYKMRIVYAHFPISASIGNKNNLIEIRNFLGEKQVHFFFLCLSFRLSLDHLRTGGCLQFLCWVMFFTFRYLTVVFNVPCACFIYTSFFLKFIQVVCVVHYDFDNVFL